ncbi:flagellar biosynthetic protein FliR [Dyella solisilvae]|uniref:Flagellar biosynthetic protein FliR n=1 Tax=Dyella solisilvae TaxID=1920168 RepID=A0A370K4Z7_9GAMM|nr:flagellar biosynthetic protein FliR [Dyella solisilvae]RDI97741.1 flagellar biosynthetic protein FliR [Dyella solisilvae]
MTSVDLADIQRLLGSLLWAMGRVGGLCLIAPVFGDSVLPQRIRLGLMLVLAFVLAPLAPTSIDLMSADGVATMVSQVLIGAAVGFVLKLAFEAVSLGGQLVGQSMSLGFAETVDPRGGGSSPVLSQFYLLMVTLLFLAMDGHLRLIALLADSFRSLPPGQSAIDGNGLHAVVAFAAHLFGGAVRVALPAMTSLLMVNIGFAAISRAAPSMNLFAVGFPITVTLGFVALWLSMRSVPGAFESLQTNAWALMHELVGG